MVTIKEILTIAIVGSTVLYYCDTTAIVVNTIAIIVNTIAISCGNTIECIEFSAPQASSGLNGVYIKTCRGLLYLMGNSCWRYLSF